MKTRLRTGRAWRRWSLVAAGVAVGLCLSRPLWSQNTNKLAGVGFVVRDFVLAEHYERSELGKGRTNLLKALVTGKEAVPQARDLYRVKEMRLEYFNQDGRTNLVARAPECTVDPNRREISSDRRVQAEANGGTLFIEGEGFFCRLTNVHLVISNNVRTVIRREPPRSHKP